MEKEKLGITQSSELLLWAFAFIKAFGASLADGKISFVDLPNFIGVMASSSAAFGGIESVFAELKDLSDEEKEEIMVLARAEFDLPDDQLELLIEDSFDAALDLYRLGQRWSSRSKVA